MTKQCKYVLNHLKKISCNSDVLLSFVTNSPYICIFSDTSVFFDYSKYETEIDSIIQFLINNGYITQGFNQYNFRLTQKAIHPIQYNIERFKNFLIQSILVPIVVSAITSIITVYITLWLKH